MAFNPFHKFRKHQKTLIAGLAIFTMFMFVAAIGGQGGDFISAVAGWFGKSKTNSPVAAELYGKEVTERDLMTLNSQRRMAWEFLDKMSGQAADKVRQPLMQQTGHEKFTPEMINQFVRSDPRVRAMIDNLSRIPRYSSDPHDLIDFKIWLHQADELGIHLTNADVMKLALQMVGA